MLQDILEFKGEWRSYQANVLKHFAQYAENEKIHIVAAPGSGKTTLGIELFRRQNKPTLILVPTVPIRDQWVHRIKEAFLKDAQAAQQYISVNLKEPKLLTVATYQALHSAISQYSGALSEEQEAFTPEETVDFQNFDLVQAMQKIKLGTICLDECHHLRREWWNALEAFKASFPKLFTVALTATPPYDAEPEEWARYIQMCGEPDAQITVPELVKAGVLCPHQDYVYFNYPTVLENADILRFYKVRNEKIRALLGDKHLLSLIQGHRFFEKEASAEVLLETPEYLSALLIYLEANGIKTPARYKRLLRAKRLEHMNPKWMEILLNYLLFEDRENLESEKAYLDALQKDLKASGLISQRHVTLQMTKNLEKTLVQSLGKIDSVKTIAEHEYKSMGSALRMLILTDYVYKEYETAIGNPAVPIQKMGVLPFFEVLRRDFQKKGLSQKLGVLCGSMVIVPKVAAEKLCQESSLAERLSLHPVGAVTDYVEIRLQGDKHKLVNITTALFEAGEIEILIGTKALLGEGWDAPSVNSLVLASVVGSYMLSNQMRGRAIRTKQGQPQKTSNIWHLVTLQPEDTSIQADCRENIDFATLCRRSEHFLGVHYEKDTIENGIERFSAIEYPFTPYHVDRTNQKMLELSENRAALSAHWMRALPTTEQIEVVRETTLSKKTIPRFVFWDTVREFLGLSAFDFLSMLANKILFGNKRSVYVLCIIGLFVLLPLYLVRLLRLGNPEKRLMRCGNGLLKALQQSKKLQAKDCFLEIEKEKDFAYSIALRGGTSRDKHLFASSMKELFAVIENQRYILYVPRHKYGRDGYFAMPNCFSNRKEDANLFAACMKPFLGECKPIYTRNEAGRKILLQARRYAVANEEQRCKTREKIKGALE